MPTAIFTLRGLAALLLLGALPCAAGSFTFTTVNDPSYRFILDVVSIRMIDPNVAVVEADVTTGVGGNLGKLTGTYVMSKGNGDWLINAARIARAPAPTAR